MTNQAKKKPKINIVKAKKKAFSALDIALKRSSRTKTKTKSTRTKNKDKRIKIKSDGPSRRKLIPNSRLYRPPPRRRILQTTNAGSYEVSPIFVKNQTPPCWPPPLPVRNLETASNILVALTKEISEWRDKQPQKKVVRKVLHLKERSKKVESPKIRSRVRQNQSNTRGRIPSIRITEDQYQNLEQSRADCKKTLIVNVPVVKSTTDSTTTKGSPITIENFTEQLKRIKDIETALEEGRFSTPSLDDTFYDKKPLPYQPLSEYFRKRNPLKKKPVKPLRVKMNPMYDDVSDGNESHSAPSEFLSEFLSSIMQRKYTEALKYCKLILKYEPNNMTAKEFYPLLVEKLRRKGKKRSFEDTSSSPEPPLALDPEGGGGESDTNQQTEKDENLEWGSTCSSGSSSMLDEWADETGAAGDTSANSDSENSNGASEFDEEYDYDDPNGNDITDKSRLTSNQNATSSSSNDNDNTHSSSNRTYKIPQLLSTLRKGYECKLKRKNKNWHRCEHSMCILSSKDLLQLQKP